MFFRREKPHKLSFDERLEKLKELGFTIEREDAGRARAVRGGCAAVVEDAPGGDAKVYRAGLMAGGEIGILVDGGFQKFFVTPGGKRLPALAGQLRALHNFEEDLREGLGLKSLYNQSLGTVNTAHLYDRVQGRDRGERTKPWEHVGR